ncbi:cation diffusion facilitator family transporter [Enterobacteriaceae endosymbiont of Donacia versicolorea]|uniref:cation diffusion facilitator family transporter n=1 Tax=Enterobacteriaceae endosymbiont of Donacia versicolorea TaxID=2675788 RepID=UPI00144A1508|nr:cation diffusion facilitator family transporter [Enterobacteriaceae endosymbiont of Donacia versicolorea]QJC31936.1 cation diffusion facilitator family transporter [Enterobacteriaceae endosymbiont of Donacia versicolorea]
MSNISQKISFKKSENEYNKLITKATNLAILLSLTLLILKLIAWWQTKSVSMLAACMDSLVDIMSSTINLLIIYYSLQPADLEHTFGHGKAESLSALAQSIFICITAIFLFLNSLKYISHPAELYYPIIGILVIIISFFLTLILVIFQKKVIKKTNSQATHADMIHYESDILINSAILFALILNFFNIKQADSIIALIISLFIFFNSFKVGYKAIQSLLDKSLPDNEKKIIIDIITSWPKVMGAHQLKTRQSGPTRFIQLHLVLEDNLPLLESHSISKKIENALNKKFPYSDIIIHQDPYSIVSKKYKGFFKK